MLKDIKEAIEAFVKATPVALLALAIASGVVLIVPDPIASALGLDKFREDNRFWIGIAFVVSCSYLLAHVIWWGWGKAVGWYESRRVRKVREDCLKELTPEEKEYLIPYIRDSRNTCRFDCTDGLIGGLEAKGIVFRSSSLLCSRISGKTGRFSAIQPVRQQ